MEEESMRTHKFTIKHKESDLTLNQYIEKYDRVKTISPDTSVSLKGEKVRYLMSESGSPGLYYHIPWENYIIYWLDKREWEIILK